MNGCQIPFEIMAFLVTRNSCRWQKLMDHFTDNLTIIVINLMKSDEIICLLENEFNGASAQHEIDVNFVLINTYIHLRVRTR